MLVSFLDGYPFRPIACMHHQRLLLSSACSRSRGIAQSCCSRSQACIGESREPPLPVDYGMILESRVLTLVHVG